MPLSQPCSNYPCRGNTDRPGGLCAECQRKQEKDKANAWKYKGWSRQDERDEVTGKKHRKETK